MLVDTLSARTTLSVSLKEMALHCVSALNSVLYLSTLFVDLTQGLTGMSVFLEERLVLCNTTLLLCLKGSAVSCILYVSSYLALTLPLADLNLNLPQIPFHKNTRLTVEYLLFCAEDTQVKYSTYRVTFNATLAVFIFSCSNRS